MTLDLSATLHSAQDIARRAGVVLRDAYHQPRHIDYKGEINLVTQADEESERLIVAALRESFPDHAILAEEGSGTDGSSGYTWVVDPLDGTTNFAHGIPIFAVSIALRGPGGDPLLGVVYDPLRDECFAATRGGGATLNDTPVRVTEETELGHAMLVTGFAYDRRVASSNFAAFTHFLRRAQGLLRLGTAAVDLAYVACGRLDGFWTCGLYPWDVAAGILLVREAGGVVTNYTGGEEGLYEGSYIVASNGHLHETMLAVLAEGDGSN
jgi:myo-inositol-1(or 4)-monophosphatase